MAYITFIFDLKKNINTSYIKEIFCDFNIIFIVTELNNIKITFDDLSIKNEEKINNIIKEKLT